MEETKTKTYYTAKDAAEALGVARKRIYALIKSGALNAANLSDGPRAEWRIKPTEIDRYIVMRTKGKIP